MPPGELQLPLTKKAMDRWLRREIIQKEMAKFYEYHTLGNTISQRILVSLSKQLKMDRFLIAGSIGKRTWLGVSEAPDFDLVILLNRLKNGDLPDSVEVIRIIADVIKKLGYPFEVTRETKHVVGAVYHSTEMGTIDFDVVPGINFYKNVGDRSSHAQSQLDGTLEYIYNNHGANYGKKPFMSASLAEAVVDFVFGQDPFTHEVIKLAKRWNKKQIDEGALGKVNGRSFTMELVAIHAATEETKELGENDRTLTGAFEKFLNVFVQSKRNVRIVFPCRVNKEFKGVHQQYNLMARSSGVILDPSNPWNNLLDGFSDNQWEQFKKAALRCLEIVKRRDTTIVDCFKSLWGEPESAMKSVTPSSPTPAATSASRCIIV